MKPVTNLYLLLFISLALSCCVSIRASETPMQIKTQTPPPRSTNTTYFAPATTRTPPPTQNSKQAEETIRKLLQEPVDCEAPCFWGMTPGLTTLDDAKKAFAYLGLNLINTSIRDNITIYQTDYAFDSGLSISLLLTIRDNIVTDSRIYITPEKRQVGIPREWLAYSPEALVNRYGPPSRIDFSIDFGGARSSFGMFMYFDKFNLIVEYAGYNVIDQTMAMPRVCPLTDQYDTVRLWMGSDPQYPPKDGVPLEQASAMTIDSFSTLITGNPDDACFNLNIDAFR